MNKQTPEESSKIKKWIPWFPEFNFTDLAKSLPAQLSLVALLFYINYGYIPNSGLTDEVKSTLSLATVIGLIVCAVLLIILHALPSIRAAWTASSRQSENLQEAKSLAHTKQDDEEPKPKAAIISEKIAKQDTPYNKTNLEGVADMNLLTKDEIPVFAAILARSGLINKGIKRENFCDLITYEASDEQLKASNEDFSKNLIPDLDKKWRRKSLILTGDTSIYECDAIEADISEYQRTVMAKALQRLKLEQVK